MSREAADSHARIDAAGPWAGPGNGRRAGPLVAFKQQLRSYLAALGVTALCTAVAFPVYPDFNVTNIAMLYLLGTAWVALRHGRGAALCMSVVNMLLLDYLFIPPLFSFEIENLPYTFTLVVMLAVAVIIAQLVVSIQLHRERAETSAARMAALYALSRELSSAPDAAGMATVAARHIRDTFQASAEVVLADAAEGAGLDAVRRVLASGGRCVADSVYEPLRGSQDLQGVLVVHPQGGAAALSGEQLQWLATLAAPLALALERAQSAAAAQAAQTASEQAHIRNTLLASISHDLRTPLAAIAGAGSLIALPDYALDRDRRVTLGHLIERKARDLTQLVSNILKFAEIESQHARLETDWQAVDELIEHSLRGNEAALAGQRITVSVPADLPLILAEGTLIVQILNNLLQNAAKYTPPGTRVEISARVEGDCMLIVVDDDGPGLPFEDPERVFEKFQRGRNEDSIVGAGLGLAICRAAARLHGGDIRAAANSAGGARFELRLPVRMQAQAAEPALVASAGPCA
jgi:two-component system sensor histidine kinase KdpD